MNIDGNSSNTNKLRSKWHFSTILFGGILLSYLTFSTISIIGAIKWIKMPFPGFLMHKSMSLASTGQYHWTGTQAGIKYPDKILKVNGISVNSPKELKEILSNTRIGEPIAYTLKRGKQIIEVTFPTMRFTYTDIVATFGSYFIASFAYMLMGFIVYIMKPNIKVSWAFLMACYFLGVYTITVFDWVSNHTLTWVYLLSISLVPASLIHFSFYFPTPQNFVSKFSKLQFIPYLISLSLGIPMVLLYPDVRVVRILYNLILAYMVIGTPVLLFPIFKSYFRPANTIARQRAKVVLIGAAIAFPIPAIAFFSQIVYGSFLGIQVQTNFLILFVPIFPASIAYAIAKHNLFDVDVFIKRAVGYAITTAVVVGAYLLVSVSLNVVVGQYKIAQSRAFPILFTLAVILIFNPMQNRIQAFVDRVFFRKEYDYGKVIDKISGAITSLLDLGEILKQLVGTFSKEMFIDTSSVMLLNTAGTAYQVYLAEGEKNQDVEGVAIEQDEPLIKILQDEKRELTKYDVLEDKKYVDISDYCAANFDSLKASLLVPLVYQEKVIGLFSLGDKKSGKFYNRQDIDLLNSIANQGAVAIENARLFQENLEKQRMEEELAIGRELQMSMLPADCPQIEGFEIAAFSESAREVGGDFYDFIEISEGRSGLVIGDVTGKSVSGALVMSASRSIFRMLGEEELTVSESMIRANKRTKKDIKTGMFVALLYAVLESKNKTISLCSAGQTQPVFRSAQTGEAELVETQGDNFPLGILDDAAYEETRLQLSIGDVVVLYTDGIVEAMNDQDEMFGFDRLIEVIQKSQTKTAETLLEEIKSNVNEFAGGALQHDDITTIVIQAT